MIRTYFVLGCWLGQFLIFSIISNYINVKLCTKSIKLPLLNEENNYVLQTETYMGGQKFFKNFLIFENSTKIVKISFENAAHTG